MYFKLKYKSYNYDLLLENGRLLVSLKSHWRFLGRELITDHLPEELLKSEV